MILSPLPRLIIEPLVRNALLEDLGLAGDITSTAVIPADHRSVVVMAAREPGVIAGLDAADLAFQLVDPAIVMKRHVQDGASVAPGDIIAMAGSTSWKARSAASRPAITPGSRAAMTTTER